MEKLERACISMHFLLKDQDKKEEKKSEQSAKCSFLAGRQRTSRMQKGSNLHSEKRSLIFFILQMHINKKGKSEHLHLMLKVH